MVQPWWVWYIYICPVFWTLYGLVTTQLGDVTETMTLQNGGVTQARPATVLAQSSTWPHGRQ